MKKLFTIMFILLMTAGNVFADNYLTFGKNDTLRINPNFLNNYFNVPVRAHFDGYLDHWRLDFTLPENHSVTIGQVQERSGMNIPYFKSDGTEDIYNAILVMSENDTVISSSTTAIGYWDRRNDGVYEPYGYVKWGPGDYEEMFCIYFFISDDFNGGSIEIDGLLTCSNDWRPDVYRINAAFFKTIHLILGYNKGDVDGDGYITILDVTTLTDYLSINLAGMDQYQLDAADVNCDGVVSISDLGALIDMLLTMGQYIVPEEEDM